MTKKKEKKKKNFILTMWLCWNTIVEYSKSYEEEIEA